MRFSKWFVMAAMAAGVMVTGVQAKAEDRFDQRRDYAHANSLRDDIAMHRARLNEDIRFGRRAAANAERRAIAHDEALLRAQDRDIRHDRNW